jgi:hypothetical protein
MSGQQTFGVRLTRCECGHQAVEHYDSFSVCIIGRCRCEEFKAAEPERYVQIGAGLGRIDRLPGDGDAA